MKQYIFILISIIASQSISAQKNSQITNNEKKIRLNPNIELVRMFISDSFDTIPVCNNDESIRVFKERINIIEQYINLKDETLLDKIIYNILNFELLTKIESESDGNFLGKYNPTYNDLKKMEVMVLRE